MRSLYITFNIFMILTGFSQIKKTIYCFPGQGSDKRIFDSLIIDEKYKIKVIEYGAPAKGMNMESFARQLSRQIDTSQAFILMGVSLGGMLCVELSEILDPVQTIIISSAKNRTELPTRYKFQKVLPVYKLFPGWLLVAGAKFLQPIVEPDRNKNKQTFKSMLAGKKGPYMKRTIGLIINWKRTSNTKTIFHIHGTSDHTLPFKKIKSRTIVVEKGSHMMTLTRAREISQILNEILK